MDTQVPRWIWHVPFHGFFALVPRVSAFSPHMPTDKNSPKEAKMNLTACLLRNNLSRGCPWIESLKWVLEGRRIPWFFCSRRRQPSVGFGLTSDGLCQDTVSCIEIKYNILQSYPRTR